MADNLGTQGGFAGVHTAQPIEGGKPVEAGTVEAPKGEVLFGVKPEGHGGSNRGAH